MENLIYSINGPVVTVKDTKDFMMMEMVYVSDKKLMGEVIAISQDKTTIQVYESTTSLKPGDKVYGTKQLLSVTLGPGIVSNIFDGIQRPLKELEKNSGAFIGEGFICESISDVKKWETKILVKIGDILSQGSIFATCQETSLITHKAMVPAGVFGRVIEVKSDGFYNINETLVVLLDEHNQKHELKLAQKCPIKISRKIKERKTIDTPLITGQRIIDTVFPMAKGGASAVPGGFGAGKTMLQHQIAKWCDADLIVYVGCGERGNEMTQVLQEFAELKDPKTNKPLLDRTVLIANTSNMPVAAREASIYTGITIAEYYRDMGYHVALMADSTSRWAEALREISGRLEEIPAEEGFPAYLASRIAAFYERAGYVKNLNDTYGSISIIGAVSPQGGDFSEPVTQNTKRFVRSFWALDKNLAYTRHFPTVNWNNSYSDYLSDLTPWYHQNVAQDFISLRNEIVSILHEETQLMEIVKLIGSDVLPDDQKLVLEIARVIRVGFLQQNAFHPFDTYVPFEKQYLMIKIIIYLYKACKKVVERKVPVSLIAQTGIFEKVIKIKYDISNEQIDKMHEYYELIENALKEIK